jgi:hypothetical protein
MRRLSDLKLIQTHVDFAAHDQVCGQGGLGIEL